MAGELETLEVVAMDKEDFVNVQKVIMEDEEYQGVLSAKGYESDTFEEGLEVYRMTFTVKVNGIPVYRNEPMLQQTKGMFVAHPVTATVLLSNSGIEMITMMGMLKACDGQQKEAGLTLSQERRFREQSIRK